MKAEDMLNKYKDMRSELTMIAYQISHFTGIDEEEIIEALSFSHPDGDPVMTSEVSDTTGKIAIKIKELVKKENNDWYQYLLDRYQELNDEICFMEYVIRSMGDKKADILLELMDGALTWDEIADQYCVSRSLIGVYRKEAVKELERGYKVRNEQETAYLLS